MSLYFKHLNLDFYPVTDKNLLDRFPLHIAGKYKLDNSVISDEMLMFLKEIGAVYWDLELFISPRNYVLLPHTDDCYIGDYAKINFVYSENDNHTMDWYEILPEWNEQNSIVKPNYADDKQGDSHYRFENNEVNIIAREKVDVALVNVGIPHGITTEMRRQCFSFIIQIEKDGKYEELTMSNYPFNLQKYFL
jgi:hypothetical protein